MSEISARLALPYLAPAQAQKHVTHNEALQRLDALTQLTLEQIDATTPPADPQPGALYALGASPTGAWAAEAGNLAYWDGTAWLFIAPQTGWQAWDKNAESLRIYQIDEWTELTTGLQNVDGVGIGTSSDAVNRLSVVSEATLLNHLGAGHQLKINKAAAGDTASLLYQSNWTGHAEMGLTGGTDFHIKVSADGSAWTDALVFDATSGLASGAAVQSGSEDTTPGRLALTEGTYGPGSILGTVGLSGGVPTGAVIEQGSNGNGTYVRFTDGTQICFVAGWTFDEESSGSRLGGGHWVYPAAFSDTPIVIPSFSNSIGTHWIGSNTHRRVSAFGCGIGTTQASTMRIFAVESTPFSTGAQITQVRLLALGAWS